VLDEALVWAARSDRTDALPVLVELGARVEADVYRGTPLAWAAANGRVASVRLLLELGADPNTRGTFGGPTHGEGVTALQLAAQCGDVETIQVLLDAGADPTIQDALHGGNARGWAEFGGHAEVARVLRAAAGEEEGA
jgi:ankyrin repeat protein